MTRRDCAKLLSLAAVAGRECFLRNEHVELRIAFRNGKVASRTFHNRVANEVVQLPAEDFELEFEGGPILGPSAFRARILEQTATRLELLFTGAAPHEVRVRYDLAPGKAYLRKQLWVRRTSGAGRLLRADLDNWRGVRRAWDSMHGDRLPFGSHPIFCETLWAGVEFVAAFNEYSAAGFVLRSRPGLKPVGAQWLALRPTAAGVAAPGGVREAFLRYIEDVRIAPPRLVACYNSWWTLPLRIKQDEHLELIRELKRQLFDKHGVFFDLVATDEGWTDPHSIWRIDRGNLPRGFDDIREIVESAGGKLGLWISPSENYPRTLDYDWAEKNGYTVVRPETNKPWGGPRGASLADPKFRGEAIGQLTRLIRENRFSHIKYDGFIAAESVPHHGMPPGQDSVEPLAEHLLELLTATRAAAPGLVAEPTCLNTLANYTSPWMLKYADTTFGSAGGDCAVGIGAAPVYRESHTSGREWFIFSTLDEIWLPQNALQFFDIIHCDDTAGFANHAAMAFGRGRFFIPTYVNPKLMSEDDWRIFAGLLRWARANHEILKNTVVVSSRVELGEPYVYAHWLGGRGILAVRNPSNESKELALDLRKTGAPAELTGAVCYTQYPYRRGIAVGLTGASTIPLKMAPWELLFLEIVPRAELRETVAMGARWYQTGVAPDAGARQVTILEPRRADRVVAVPPRQRGAFRGELVSESVRRLGEAEWLTRDRKFPCVPPQGSCSDAVPSGQRFPSLAFDIECSITLPPGGAKGKALLLLQYPVQEHRPSHCRAGINGVAATLGESHSAGHLRHYYAIRRDPWKRVLPYAFEGSWYICELGGGTSRVRFTGAAGHPQCRIGLWAWMETDVAQNQVRVEAAFGEPAMPQHEPHLEREGICLK